MFLGCFSNQESNCSAVICGPYWAQYAQAISPPWWGASSAIPVEILLVPCWAVDNQVSTPRVRQVSAPWHPGDSRRQVGQLVGTVNLLWALSDTAQVRDPQDLRGLMLSQGIWSTTSILDKWISGSLCELITYLFPQFGEIWDVVTLSWPLNNLYFMQKELKSFVFFLSWLGYSMISLGWSPSVFHLCWWPQDAESIDRIFYF